MKVLDVLDVVEDAGGGVLHDVTDDAAPLTPALSVDGGRDDVITDDEP